MIMGNEKFLARLLQTAEKTRATHFQKSQGLRKRGAKRGHVQLSTFGKTELSTDNISHLK